MNRAAHFRRPTCIVPTPAEQLQALYGLLTHFPRPWASLASHPARVRRKYRKMIEFHRKLAGAPTVAWASRPRNVYASPSRWFLSRAGREARVTRTLQQAGGFYREPVEASGSRGRDARATITGCSAAASRIRRLAGTRSTRPPMRASRWVVRARGAPSRTRAAANRPPLRRATPVRA